MATIIRGTTPTITFNFSDVTVSSIEVAILSIKQAEKTIIEKTLTEAVVGETSLSWKLTQEETLSLNEKVGCKIVCDWKLNDGTRGRSKFLTVDTGEAGKDEVI